MLEVAHLQAAYGPAQVLFDIGFRVGAGEVVTLLGRNGMGKTTTIHALMGLVRALNGSAMFEGLSLIGLPPYRIAQAGLGLVPEGRQVFAPLTVEENLTATAVARGGAPRWTLERVYTFFPQLAERRRNMGNELSGGEQQMLAIGRALMTNPKLLILDEATEGLAPLVRAEIWNALARLKAEGQAILVVDKHLGQLRKLADRHVIIEKGEVVWSGASDELSASVIQRYLQV
jgi:branched-chain amino acid transport system ATP-binding protein